MIRLLHRLRFLLFALPMAPVSAFADGENIIAACSPWPPYVVDGEKPGGILVDYVEDLLQGFGYSVRIDVFPWKRAIEAARSGNVDVIFCAEEGQAKTYGLEYEFPILISDTVLLSHRDAPLEASQVWHHRIALGAGYWYGDAFESRRQDVDTIEVVDDLTILRMVASNRADGGLMEKAVLDSLLHTYPELAEMIHVSSEPVTTQTFYFAISPTTQIDMRHLRQHITKSRPKPIIQQINSNAH